MFWRKRPKPPASVVPLREIVQHFNEAAADEENFPSTIDPRIYHVQLILEYFGDLNGKRVLDVGCGKGRFARVLAERYPQGVDCWASIWRRRCCGHVPPGIARLRGIHDRASVSRRAAFDCAYATESLEHAVEIDDGGGRDLPRGAARRPHRDHR